MKARLLIALGITAILSIAIVTIGGAVSGAAFTTFNPWVDGLFKDVCKNSIINCNIYGMKQDVWLNGGPAANGLSPNGQYFFAVLVPGGQPNPNDGGPKNLSDDYDTYGNRTFTITDGEVSAYTGTHWKDSGNFLTPNRQYCHDKRGCQPDNKPPLLRLYPYADTTNPGGVYILAICSLSEGYPVDPRDCKYDAFKVKETFTADLLLSGIKFEDMYGDGKADWISYVYEDPGLEKWQITIKGTGFLGEPIDVIVGTNADGFWSYQKSYTYTKTTTLVNANLTICEVLQPGWVQSYPVDPKCYTKVIEPAALAEVKELDFGNWYPGEKNGVKFEDLDADGEAREAGEPGLADWTIFVDYDGEGDLDAGEPFAVTDSDGAYSIKGIKPGTWTVREVLKDGWTCSYPDPCNYVEEFTSRAVFNNNDFGNWYPATKGGYKWYDRNANGTWDQDEPAIPGWKIEVYAGDVLVDWQYTDADGYYEFTLKPGTYTVKEVCPSANWYQTWPVPIVGCSSGVYTVTLVSRWVETDNNFGNYCAGTANFDTKGYWHNKNGLEEITQTDIDHVNTLPPYSGPVFYWAFPFDGVWSAGSDEYFGIGAWAEISDFLPDRVNAAPAQEQLSQQLLAFIFNTRHRLDNTGATIQLPDGSWMSAEDVINSAIAAWQTPELEDDHEWESIIDALNNNDAVPFISYDPCEVVYP